MEYFSHKSLAPARWLGPPPGSTLLPASWAPGALLPGASSPPASGLVAVPLTSHVPFG